MFALFAARTLRNDLVAQLGEPAETNRMPVGADVLYWDCDGVTFTQALQRIEATPDLGCFVFHRRAD